MKIKIIFSAIAAAALVLVPIARAQETETPTSESSPSATADESTSSSSEETTTSKKSSAEESPKYPTPGSAAATASASPAKSSTSASASPSGKASASPAAKQARPSATPVVLKGSAESQMRQIEDLYETATMNHNVALVEPYMADDFVVTDSKGRVMNRRSAVAEFKKDADTYTTAKNSGVKVHMIAPNVAVVTGKAHEAGKDKAGKPFDRSFLYTDTFVNRGGKWLVAATHVSIVSGK